MAALQTHVVFAAADCTTMAGVRYYQIVLRQIVRHFFFSLAIQPASIADQPMKGFHGIIVSHVQWSVGVAVGVRLVTVLTTTHALAVFGEGRCDLEKQRQREIVIGFVLVAL